MISETYTLYDLVNYLITDRFYPIFTMMCINLGKYFYLKF